MLLFDRRSRQATLTAAGQELLDEGRRLLERDRRRRQPGQARRHRLGDAADDRRRRRHLAHHPARALRVVLRLLGGAGEERLARRGRGDADAAGDPPALAHRGAGRHLGGADHRPGRPGDRRRRQPRAAARRDDEGPRADGIRVRGRAASSAGAAERAARRLRADPPSRHRRGRFGAADDADHPQPARRPGRAHGQRHERQDRCPAALARLRLRARADGPRPHRRRPPGGEEGAAHTGSRAASATPGARRWRRAAARPKKPPLGLALRWWLEQLESETTRKALLERHGGRVGDRIR